MGVTASGYGVFWSEEMSWNWILMVGTQHFECAKCHCIVHFQRVTFILCASQKKLYETILKYLEFSIIYM